MIRHIKTLKQELNGKKLYIWDVGKKATWVFSFLAYRLINVTGFVTPLEKYAGETFMNRPIITMDEFGNEPDAVLIYDDSLSLSDLPEPVRGRSCIRYSEALEYHPELYRHSHYLYGTAGGAWSLLKEFVQRNISVKGFLLSEMKPPDSILGLPVRECTKGTLAEDDSVVVTAVSENVSNRILLHLFDSGFTGTVYIPGLISYMDIWGTDPFPMLDEAAKHGKKILLCAEDDMGRELLHEALSLYGIRISRDVTLKGDAAKGLEDIYSLADEDPERSVLLIHSLNGVVRNEIVTAAEEMGFSAGAHAYAGTRKTVYNRKRLTGELEYESDERMQVSIDYTPVGGKPGWAVFGDEKGGGTRIMVLGGSTSSEIYYPESWVSKLYRRIVREKGSAVIFNGSQEMEDAGGEFRRMTRDIHHIRPDIVISMSGINNLTKKDNKFERWYRETPFEFWYRTEQYMKLVAEAEGAKMFVFLQPINVVMQETDLRENLLFISESMRRCGTFCRQAEEGGFYHNLLNLFHHREDRFIDFCHYSEAGHQEIAERVYETIKDVL